MNGTRPGRSTGGPDVPVPTDPGRNGLRRLLPLALVIGAGIFVHLAILVIFPLHRTFGDEANYTLEAHRIIDGRALNLIPGNMIFRHRPPFAFSYYSLFARHDLIRHPDAEKWIVDRPHDHWSPEMTRFVRAVSLANLVMLALLSVVLYAICGRLGLRRSASTLAAALMMLNPRTGFFVQSLWPEILHMFLFMSAIWLLLVALDRTGPRIDRIKVLALVLSGVLLGYAALTRGVVGLFFWVLLVFTFFAVRRGERTRSPSAPLMRALVCAGILLVAYQAVLVPQRLANLVRHGTSILAHNTWRNIEAGLMWSPVQAQRYLEASDDPEVREAMARDRVIAYVLHTPAAEIIRKQSANFVRRLDRSYVDRGFELRRWGDRGAGTILRTLTAVFSWSLFLLGLAGLVIRGRSSPGSVLLSLFTLYYLAGLFVVIFSVRMFVQLIPPLIIFTAALADTACKAASRRGGRRARRA